MMKVPGACHPDDLCILQGIHHIAQQVGLGDANPIGICLNSSYRAQQ